MFKRTPLLVAGVVLLALSAIWFLTPVGMVVFDRLGFVTEQARGIDDTDTTYTVAVMALNVLNTLFAGLGAFFAALALRKPQ